MEWLSRSGLKSSGRSTRLEPISSMRSRIFFTMYVQSILGCTVFVVSFHNFSPCLKSVSRLDVAGASVTSEVVWALSLDIDGIWLVNTLTLAAVNLRTRPLAISCAPHRGKQLGNWHKKYKFDISFSVWNRSDNSNFPIPIFLQVWANFCSKVYNFC